MTFVFYHRLIENCHKTTSMMIYISQVKFDIIFDLVKNSKFYFFKPTMQVSHYN
jgi:hypothetical protein